MLATPSRFSSVLIVDDSQDDAFLIARDIRKQGYTIAWERVDTAEDMRRVLGERYWDIIISDYNIPGFGAEKALALHKELGRDGPFIVISGKIDEEIAVSLLKAGAHDFVMKTNLSRLVPALEREFRDWKSRQARIQAENALRASEERYALAARGANDVLWDWDLATDSLYLSPRWKGIVGLGAPDDGLDDFTVKPREWFDHIHPDDIDAVLTAINTHLAGRSANFVIEHRLRHDDGNWRWVLARGMAVHDTDGDAVRMAGSFTDITATKHVEQQLRKTMDELTNALASKTRFLAAASHDLRQPFQAMRLYQYMLSEKVMDAECRKIVTNLGEAMSAGEALLHALLDVSTLDAGVVPVKRSVFSVFDALSSVGREFAQEAVVRGITLRVAGCQGRVDSDPTLFARIVRNLVTNALRYTPSGGRVLIACRRRGAALAVEVWDTGIGIAPEMQEAIFEDFIQVGNPQRDRRNGLGLGLAIVRRMAQLLGSDISLSSQPGRGSRFTITLPGVTPEVEPIQAAPSPQREEVKSLGAQRILVIEDDEIQGAALRQLIEGWGYSVSLAANAEEAFARVMEAATPPHLIVSDFRLPGDLNGVEAIARICSDAHRHIPAVIITGDTARERIKEATATGHRLLHKPYDPTELKRVIAQLLAYPEDTTIGSEWLANNCL